MTKVRICPACSDRVAAEDVFCEGCGRPLPEDVMTGSGERPDSVPTTPQASMSGAVPPGASGGDGPKDGSDGGTRPGLVPGEGAPTAPQVSLKAGRSTGGPAEEASRSARGDSATTPSQGGGRSLGDQPPPATGDDPGRPADPDLCAWCPGRVSGDYCETCGFRQPTGRDHVEVRTRGAVGVSDRGLRHKRNEDAMAIRVIGADASRAPGTVCAVVCDGVSSSPRSDEASRVTADTGVTVLAEQVRKGVDPREATGAAMTRAAEAVAGIADSPSSAPACTFVSAVVDPDTGAVTVGWVGDSRAYWLSGGPTASASALLTKDDSWSEAMVQMGALSREEAMRSANAHALIAWMGADSGEIDAHISTVTPAGPGAVVLCSDGLWNYYPEAQALTDAVPGAGASPHDAARAYVSLALQAGGKDNITVVVIPVPSGGPRAGHD